MIWWWVGNAVLVLVVIPVVVVLATRVVKPLREIRSYAQVIAEHGAGLAHQLDGLDGLTRSRRLIRELRDGVVQSRGN